MAGKLLITGDLIVLTGLHIGGGDSFSAIGSVDSTVVKTARTGEPYVPGSSLKGKLRTLITRSLTPGGVENLPEKPENDKDEVKRLFGSSETNNIKRSRLQFSDAYLNKDFVKSIKEHDGSLTEVKAENTINRATSVANPRFIERVIPGADFEVKIIYDVMDEDEVADDLDLLIRGLKLLQLDYLGGHGTRGSGRVSFRNLDIKPVEVHSPVVEALIDPVKEKFKEIEENELLSI